MSHKSIAPYTLPTEDALALLRLLTIGQRQSSTLGQLALFLHEQIFPRLGPFAVEMYLPREGGGTLYPLEVGAGISATVPPMFPAETLHPFFLQSTPRILSFQPSLAEIIDSTGNISHIAIPIVDTQNFTGLIYLGSRQVNSFSETFLTFLETLAAVIGSRLKSLKTIHRLQESLHALEYSEQLRSALYDISEQAQHAENMADLYAKLHRKMACLLDARNFSIALIEQRGDKKILRYPYYADQFDGHLQGVEQELSSDSTTLVPYLLDSGSPLLLTPESLVPFCAEHGIRWPGTVPHSWLGAPFSSDHISGVVAVHTYRQVVYTERDKALLSFLAGHVGSALNRKIAFAELTKAKERAEQAERKKSIFLANMSHEIRTPMNGILGLTELVLSGDISAQQRSYLEMVHASADRLLKLINDILDFSKIEAGRLELDIAPFSLRETISSSLEILALSAARKKISLFFDCAQEVPDALLGDADKLRRVLINLLGNGIKFTEHGSVSLFISLSRPDFLTDSSVHLSFAVSDTGIGIPFEKQEQVFTAFSQIGTTRDSNNGGTGLGLVIAAELVEMMGGNIVLASEVGKGTTFSFELTIMRAPSLPDSSQSEVAAGSTVMSHEALSSLNILLVEDEFINRTLAVSILEREGWQVTEAEDASKALALLADARFDLILMDIQMPQLNGYEATAAIRRNQAERGQLRTPIIAMTAYAVKGDRETCLAAGMDGYISKPIHPQKVRREIESVLNLYARQTSKDGLSTTLP